MSAIALMPIFSSLLVSKAKISDKSVTFQNDEPSLCINPNCQNTDNPDNLLHRHLDVVNSLVFSPDGQTIFSGSQDSTIKMWRIN